MCLLCQAIELDKLKDLGESLWIWTWGKRATLYTPWMMEEETGNVINDKKSEIVKELKTSGT